MLDEDDYMYGIGPLRLRVAAVAPSRVEPGWALVSGVPLDFRGVEREPREVLVRMKALLGR